MRLNFQYHSAATKGEAQVRSFCTNQGSTHYPERLEHHQSAMDTTRNATRNFLSRYSMNSAGGTRCQMALRPLLSELGCLPVSRMAQFPEAHKLLNEDGTLVRAR